MGTNHVTIKQRLETNYGTTKEEMYVKDNSKSKTRTCAALLAPDEIREQIAPRSWVKGI